MKALLSYSTGGTFYEKAKAEEIAAIMNANEEDGWTYEVVDPGNDRGLVKIVLKDEEGEVVVDGFSL